MPKDDTYPQRRQHTKYERLIEAAKANAPLPTAVAHPCDETSLAGALEAYRAGLIVPLLVGPADKIRKLAKAGGIDITGVEIIDAPHSQAAAEKAVALVREGKAELLKKGSLHSDELLAEVTKRDTGLRTGRASVHLLDAVVVNVPVMGTSSQLIDRYRCSWTRTTSAQPCGRRARESMCSVRSLWP
jgi:phosphate acetyltransferase